MRPVVMPAIVSVNPTEAASGPGDASCAGGDPSAVTLDSLRGGSGFVPKADTVVEAGDEVLVVLDPGIEEDITAQFVGGNGRG